MIFFQLRAEYKKPLKVIINLASILIILSQLGCKPIREQTNRIIVASRGKVDSIDPAQANKLLALQLISALGDTLYKRNNDGSLVPSLASQLPRVSNNGLTIAIPLRKDVLFHDGTKFDAEAMAFSMRRFIKIGTLNYIIGGKIKKIETPEPYLLKIHLSNPSSSINGLLTSANLTPISPTAYSQNKEKFLNKRFIGTGPYQLYSFTPERQQLVPFKKYWGTPPLNQGIDYISYTTSTSLFSAIKTGQIDVLLSSSIEDGHRLALHRLSEKGYLLEGIGPAMQIGYIAFKSNTKPLNEKILRQAILYSLDRELLSNQVSYGLRRPLRSIVPPVLKENSYSAWPKYNRNTAKTLFKKAGLCDTRKVTIPLTFRSNVPADKLVAIIWQQQIKRDFSDCIEIKLNGVESTTVYKQLSEGVFDAVILGWTGEYPDPQAYLSPLLDCTKINKSTCEKGEAVYGGTFWASNKLQKALQESDLLTGNERINKLDEIEFLAADGAALLPIWLVNPRAWAQTNISKPKFDGNGRLLLDQLKINAK